MINKSNAQVSESMEFCHEVACKRARNFYYGMKLTPEPKRSAMYAIYAFMRACDDLADDGDLSGAEGKQRLEAFRQTMNQVLDGDGHSELPEGRYWPAFWFVCRNYPIDRQDIDAMLAGQVCDLEKNRYATFDELYDYCYKVASVVGLVCISIWGYEGGEATRKLAEYRGIALQLTNILRDLAEDAARGRIYLPGEDLARFGYSEQQLLEGQADDAFERLMTFQIERAQRYYRKSADLERHIDPSCRSACWAMMRIYRGLLERMAARPRMVLDKRVRLSSIQKASIAICATWKRTWEK